MTEKELHAFYSSAAWIRKRAEILRRNNYECQECKKRIAVAARDGVQLCGGDRWIHRAVAVHHIKHLRDFPELALDDNNLESVCADCHNRLHDRSMHGNVHTNKRKPLTGEKW